jgi:hypothetical protein
MFAITKQELKSLKMRQEINRLTAGVMKLDPIAITDEVSICRDDGCILWATYEDQSYQIDPNKVYQGYWVLLGNPGQTAATRILDALNTIA